MNCNVVLNNSFVKCISVESDICYVFIGNNDNIVTGIKMIIKNYRENKSNFYDNIEEQYINKIYGFLQGQNENQIMDDINDQKTFITKEMYFEEYKDKKDNLKFIFDEKIYNDDINQTIIEKISVFCYDDDLIIEPQIYAWYKDINDTIKPLSFKYQNESIDYQDIYEESIEDCIDTLFINQNNEKMNQMNETKLLSLYNNHLIKDNVIYFLSLDHYLEKSDKRDMIIELGETKAELRIDMKRFIYGIILKYWPRLTEHDVINGYSTEIKDIRRKEYVKSKERIENYARQISKIENPYYREKINEMIKCNYELLILKLDSLSYEPNTIHLSKIFNEYALSSKVPFIKVMLNSHSETYFKLYDKCLSYQGETKTKERFISKTMSEAWSNGYNVQTEYGIKYLHTDNVLMMKIFTDDRNLHSTLIIHSNGDMECIIEKNVESVEKSYISLERLYEMLDDCNSVIELINKNQYWSFAEIKNVFTKDIFSKLSTTSIDFMNSNLTFSKNDFERKKQFFPNWNVWLNNFIMNFPVFFRVRSKEEVELDVNKIFSRYKRVNNFANLSTIHSAISMYSILYNDKEEVIYNVAKDYNQDQEYIRLEYDAWLSLITAQEDFGDDNLKRKKPIQETGAEVIIYQDDKGDIKINIHNIRTFDEENRILYFLKTMMGMYQTFIMGRPYGQLYRDLFLKVDIDQVVDFAEEEQGDDEDFDVEDFLNGDEDTFISDQDLSDEEGDDDEINFEDLGGGGNSEEEVFEVKSYYLKRLKEYDNPLFKFKSKKKQKDGSAYGYPKYCTVSPSLGDRQPIAVTDEELERINNSYEDGSGRSSYSRAISVDGRSDKIKYICPKYWDISRGLSIRPEVVDAEFRGDVVPSKLPKGSKGRTTKYILERSGTYWEDASNHVNIFNPEERDESKQLHPEGYGLPCCYNFKETLRKGNYVTWFLGNEQKVGIVKGVNEKIASVNTSEGEIKINIYELRKIKKEEYLQFSNQKEEDIHEEEEDYGDEVDEKDKYISNKDPVEKGKYGHIHPFLMNYFKQSPDTFNYTIPDKKQNYPVRSYGFLRMGVEQNYSKYIFTNSPLLQCYIHLLEDYFEYGKDNINEIRRNAFINAFVQLKISRNEEGKGINEEDLIDLMESYLIHNLDLFQKCSIIKYFRKSKQELTSIDIDHIKEILTDIKDKKSYDISIVNGLLKDLNEEVINITLIERNYLFNLVVTLYNFKNYLLSDEEIQDKYLLPVLNMITEVNIVIFENIDGEEISIRCDEYYNSGKYAYIYKNDHYYEPMLYRYGSDKTDLFLLKKDMIMNGHYEIIVNSIDEKIKSFKENELDKYEILLTNEGYYINSYCLNNYSEIQYIIGSKRKGSIVDLETSIVLPIQPQSIPTKNDVKLQYKLSEDIIKTLKYTLSYLEVFSKKNKEFNVQKIFKNETNNVTSIVLENDIYIPVKSSREVPDEYVQKVEEDIHLLELENVITNNNPEMNEADDFIQYNSYEKYICKLAFQHILHKIDTIKPYDMKGYIVNTDGYKVNQKIHFTYDRRPGKSREINFIIRLDKVEALNTPIDIHDVDFTDNFSIDGLITDIYDSDIKDDEFPDIKCVNIKIDFIDQLKKIINDDIMINIHKKKLIYDRLKPKIEDLFFPLPDDIYEENITKRYITLCNYNRDNCEYPCVSRDDECKLYIKEMDIYGNLLIEKIIYKFIEKLLIYGIDNRLQIIDEQIDINDIRMSIKENEIFYTYIEYKRDNILENIYMKRSKYINEYGKSYSSIRKRELPLKKLDMIPYFVTKLYGVNSSILINLYEVSSDFHVLSKSLNEVGYNISVEDIKENILIPEIDGYSSDKLLREYNGYKDINQLKTDIQRNDKYSLDYIDLDLILKGLTKKGIQLGIILLTQKYNQQKKTNYMFISTENELDLDTSIISFFHTKLKEASSDGGDEFRLSNIISENRYSLTISELYEKNDYHTKYIKVE